MNTNNKGELIKYMVTGFCKIEIVTEFQDDFNNEELPIFETLEEATIHAFESANEALIEIHNIVSK